MAALVPRIEWNSRAAAVIAVLLFGTFVACAPALAQDEEEESVGHADGRLRRSATGRTPPCWSACAGASP